MNKEKNLEKLIFIPIICISSILLVLSTEPFIKEKFGKIFRVEEIIVSFIFLFEYIFRVFKAKSKIRYILSFLGIIDLFSFLPFFIGFFNIFSNNILLLLQLFRLLKLVRYFHGFKLLGDVLKEEAESLMVAIAIMFIIVIFASVGIYIFEHNVQPETFGSVPRAMWWAIVTLTTVGYGDVTPITPQGKIFATFITIAGVGLVSLPAGIIASGFTEQLRLRREKFEMEVEHLVHDDGKLSKDDIKKLDKYREDLGIDKEVAKVIIKHILQKEKEN